MPAKIVEHESIRPRKAQRTGIYHGPGGDSRYYKAGADIHPAYEFDHERTPGADHTRAAELVAERSLPKGKAVPA